MSIPAFLLFLAGLGLLIGGAEFLVRGATRMAVAAGIPPVVVGLTVVSYGTSSPELAVAVQSAWSSQTQLGLGNIIGSNIFNVLFVLGLSAAITPLVVSRRLVRLDVPVMVGLSFLVLLMGLDGEIGRLDGIVLTIGAIVYTAWLLRSGRKENKGGVPPANAGVCSPCRSYLSCWASSSSLSGPTGWWTGLLCWPGISASASWSSG